MKAELKQKWIEALRSGKYQQADRALCEPIDDGTDRYAYCCLGVLAEVAGKPRRELLGNEHLDRIGLTHLLGPWWNADEDITYDPTQPQSTMQRQLAALNDRGASFAEIADYIEANVPAECTADG